MDATSCSDCNPVSWRLTKLQRVAFAYWLASIAGLTALGASRTWHPLAQGTVFLISFLGMGVLVFWSVREVKTTALAQPPPPILSPSETADLSLRYMEASDRALFGWTTLLALGHSVAGGGLLHIIQTHDNTDLLSAGLVLLALAMLSFAALVGMQAGAERARRVIHVAKHHPTVGPLVSYTHVKTDGWFAPDALTTLVMFLAIAWGVLGAIGLSFGLLLAWLS